MRENNGDCVRLSADELQRSVREVGEAVGATGAALFHPVRRALSGSESGPDLGKVMEALGQKEVIRRLRLTLMESQV